MENYEYVESGIILNIKEKSTLDSFPFKAKDFAVHGKAFSFITNFYDDFQDFPSKKVLSENFPDLDINVPSTDFGYLTQEFRKQVIFRNVVQAFQQNKEKLKTDPKMALAKIMDGLEDINVVYDEDVTYYDSNQSDRFENYKEKIRQRKLGDGLMGIQTPFRTINMTGVGWQPADLISMFARPTVGKTWMCIQVAATAIMNGYKTLFISSEMPTAAINLRMDVVIAKMKGYEFSHKALRNGDPINEEQYQEFLNGLDEKNLLVCDHIEGESTISIGSIQALIRKHNPDFVVVDGIYLVSSGDGRKAMWEQNHSLFYGMKNICLATNKPIFVSTQATREAADIFTPPRVDQVAFGDALIRASDIAIAMSKVEESDDQRMVQYQKYRDGILPSDTSFLTWDVDKGYIEEINEFKTEDIEF